MSSVEGDPAESFGEVERRSRRAQRVVALVYLGIPLVFLGLVLWIGSSADTFNWQIGLVPLALLVIGWFLRQRHRYKPGRWATAGMWMGGITGFFTALATIVLDANWLATLSLPAAIVGAILGVALGRYGQRTLMHPAVPELAESPYELTFRVRGLTRLRLVIRRTDLVLVERVPIRTAEGDSPAEKARTYPLASVTGTYEVSLSGAERLRFPEPLRLAPAGTPGPALILQAKGADWVLPQNEAAAIAQILDRRIATARSDG
ncbi:MULTISPECIES: hypothetical protein [Kribbella]|uniref:hypothetical protein n=1 Tax=Kribbella TaxID=182639 RepID=UPI001046A9FE|nr:MULTISPECIES: hypothetical protein [Kribbella]